MSLHFAFLYFCIEGPGAKKRTYERSYVHSYVLLNLYEFLYVLQNSHVRSYVRSYVLQNLYGRLYVRSYGFLYVLPNSYGHLYVLPLFFVLFCFFKTIF